MFTPTPTPTPETSTDENDFGIEFWFGALVLISFISWGATRTGAIIGKVRWGIRWGLSSFIGGLVFYIYFGLNLPLAIGSLLPQVIKLLICGN
jgi:hypothetical protein